MATFYDEGNGGTISTQLRQAGGGRSVGTHVVAEEALGLLGEESSHSGGCVRHTMLSVDVGAILVVQRHHGDGASSG